jgi:hypothetical protein
MHAELHNGHCVSVYTDVNTTALQIIAYIYRGLHIQIQQQQRQK